MRKKIITLLILLTIATLLIAAPANPATYSVTVQQEQWLSGGDWDFINHFNNPLYIAQIGINRNDGPNWKDNITVLISSNDEQGRFINTSDSSKFFYSELHFINTSGGGTTVVDSFPYPITINNIGWYQGNTIRINILPRGGSLAGYEGTYSIFYRMQFFVDYGTPDQIELKDYEAVFNILTYYISPTAPPAGQSYFSHLFVDQYPSADNIDIVNLMTFNNPLTVGAVNFSSNDDRSNAKYKITVSPNQYHPSGYFAFHKTSSPASTIPFKVFVPSRNTPKQTAFTLNVPAKGPANYWQDYFEIAISDVNYNNQTLVGGDYVSEIKIELTID